MDSYFENELSTMPKHKNVKPSTITWLRFAMGKHRYTCASHF